MFVEKLHMALILLRIDTTLSPSIYPHALFGLENIPVHFNTSKTLYYMQMSTPPPPPPILRGNMKNIKGEPRITPKQVSHFGPFKHVK